MKNFYTMDISELVKDYEDITERMKKVDSETYIRMSKARNAMHKALENRGYFKKAHNKSTAPKSNRVWGGGYVTLTYGMH